MRVVYVVFVIDDGVEGHIFVLQAPLRRLQLVGAVVALNEALELTIQNRTMSQGTLITKDFSSVDMRGIKWNFFS